MKRVAILERVLGQRGFSLAEVLVATVFVLWFAAMLQQLQRAVLHSLRLQEERGWAQQTARAAVDVLAHELRLSGYNAAGPPLAALLAASPDVVAIQSDLDGDGDTDDANERVTYQYDATRQALMRATGAAPPQPMLDRVPAGLFAFRYYDANGAELSGVLDAAARARVRRIDIQFTVEYPNPDPALPAPVRLTQATRVTLRNPPS